MNDGVVSRYSIHVGAPINGAASGIARAHDLEEGRRTRASVSAIYIADPSLAPQSYNSVNRVTVRRSPLLVRDLGWTDDEIRDTRTRLQSFAELWDDPEMDVYDDM
jgi:hypothetical protein